jgi:hypothetical protein
MAIHVVNVGIFPVDAAGNVLEKRSKNTTLKEMMTANTEHRVIPDVSHAPNSAAYPTVKAYLIAEEAAGYLLQHLDQYTIVTRHA